ncbi:MAG: Coenzyme F420 hydrogenase/dehydrogenase, beta subunit C-terminal domain [Thermoplasmatales archaeon]|nr:MAG: Coenzyme F420 hydrogenase/dehydrogenase, beta subunit C-terminal domain [Thermoplasmatales archaeon]
MTDKILKVKNGDTVGSVNDLLKDLLNSKKVQALLVMQEVPSKAMAFPVLISNPDKLNSNVFAPVLPVSTASIISKITKIESSSKPIGVVMRSCQIRALIELVKLNQANIDNIVIIGIDCLGTYPVNVYSDFPENTTPTNYLLSNFPKNSNDIKYLRSACKSCKDPIPINADLLIGLYDMNPKKELLIQINSDKGKKLIEGIKLDSAKDTKNREISVKNIREEKNKNRIDFIKEGGKIKGIDALAKFFDKCINCHNCMKVCPICYCKECLFDSSVFNLEANKYIGKAEKKGLFKMPNDSLLFHTTRMNHMVVSCVGCGLCEQACPSDIPLMEIIIPIGENAQKEFDYSPGIDIEKKIPMVIYKEDEYQEVGEK